MANIKVVRVQNIPSTQSDVEFRQLLIDAAGPDITIRAELAPSCTVHNGSQAAIVKFSPRFPEFLNAMAADYVGTEEHHVCLPSDGEMYTFDKHFFGLTQLYPTLQGAETVADIVAVTGLNGRGYDSWRGANPRGDMWLQNFFHKDLPCVRTMIYGYNTKWMSPGTADTDDFRAGLSLALQNARRTVSSTRPLIFIGHSFGALIVGQLLMDWKYNDTTFAKSAFQATRALFLFGAPHFGMDIDDIAEVVASRDANHRVELLQSLGFQNEHSLIAEAKRLSQLSNSFKIFSFYERRLSRRLAPAAGDLDKYERSGTLFDYVSRASSTLGLPYFLEQRIPVDANHSDLVKFGHPSDQTYQIILQFIQDMLNLTASSEENLHAVAGSATSSESSNSPEVGRAISEPSLAEIGPDDIQPVSQTQTDPWKKDQDGKIPLHYKAADGLGQDLMPAFTPAYPEILVQTDLSGKTPLHYAAQNGNTDAMNWLLSKSPTPRAYILQPDNDGNTAQDLALRSKHYNTGKVLQTWLDHHFR